MSNAVLGTAGDPRHLRGAGRYSTGPMSGFLPPGAAAGGQAGNPGAWKRALHAYIWASEQLPQEPRVFGQLELIIEE